MFLVLHLETMLTGRVQYPPVTSTVSVTGSGIVHALLYTHCCYFDLSLLRDCENFADGSFAALLLSQRQEV